MKRTRPRWQGIGTFKAWIAEHTSASWWVELGTQQKLGVTLVGWALHTVPFTTWNTRLSITALWLAAFCAVVQPDPTDVATDALLQAAGDVWQKADLTGRLGLNGAAHLTIYAVLGPAHVVPCLAAWLSTSLALTNPPAPAAFEAIGIVEKGAVKPVRELMREGEGDGKSPPLQRLDCALFSVIVLRASDANPSLWLVRHHSRPHPHCPSWAHRRFTRLA